MSDALTFAPTKDPKVVRSTDGKLHAVPEGWACLPPGDAGLTRRVKAAGPSWAVVEKVGRKTFSKGVWAPAQNIDDARAVLEVERASPAYEKKRASGLARREREQGAYVEEFGEAVRDFLAFTSAFATLEHAVVLKVTAHATPVGSGTVARTERIPVGERAESAVIAWMRHQTTAYDSMKIARVKGERRAVRRQLAEISRAVLDLHRGRIAHPPSGCPLCSAVK